MSVYEIIGFVTGLACVYLAYRQHIWNWPIGIINAGSWLLLFWTSRLFFDSLLQVVYLILGFWGWWFWLYGQGQKGAGKKDELPVTRTPRRTAVLLTLIGIVSMIVVTPILVRAHDTAPLPDAFTTVVSLIAQYMLIKKYFGNWTLWILVDVIYTVLYTYKGLYLTASLQPIFAVICILAYRSWSKELKAGTAQELTTAIPPTALAEEI